MLEKVTASLAADQGLLAVDGGSGGSGGNVEGGAPPGASGGSIMNALQESNQQLGASMNDMYEKQCALERQRLEMMSSMMQANQLQNQQMVSLMTMLAQRLPMAPQPASNKRDRDDHHE
jgi:hypothetical protein